MFSIPCIIFAGGKSSRMGADKALLPFGNQPTLTQYQLEKFSPYFKDVYISCKNREKFDFEANFIEDNPLYETSAPFIALLSTFETLSCDKVFVISVDTPFFDKEHVQKLLQEECDNAAIIVAKSSNGAEPLCGIYKKEILPILKALIAKKEYRFSGLFDKLPTKYISFSDDTIFTNLNHPEDYEKALQRKHNG